MRSVTVALAVGLALTAIAVVVTLAKSPITVAGTNSVPIRVEGELEKGDVGSCQSTGTIPSGTSAIRIAIEPHDIGPKVTVKVTSGSRILAEGEQPAGWGSASTVTVPVKRFNHAVSAARICTTIGATVQPFRFRGMRRPAPVGANKLQDVNLHMEYMQPGPKSWWSLIPSVAYHMGLGRAASGTWIVYLVLALMIAVAVLASRLTLKELR